MYSNFILPETASRVYFFAFFNLRNLLYLIEKKIADDETVKKLIKALEAGSILYEAYFKLIIATGMRRGECCALKWEDINYIERSIHVCRNAVKTTGDEIIVKAPKTKAGK